MNTQKVNLSKDERDKITTMLLGDTFKLFCQTISARVDLKQIEFINDSEAAKDGTNRSISADAAKEASQEYRTFLKIAAEARKIATTDKDFFLIEVIPTNINDINYGHTNNRT